VRDVQRGQPGFVLDGSQELIDFHPGYVIEGAERLVEQKHLRMTTQRAPQGDALRFTAAEAERLAVQQIGDA
jgi:hypothetical protein